MNDKVYTPLFDFNTLFDTDVGIMILIGSKFLDSSVFSTEWFKEHSTNRAMVKALYERVDSNPLIQASIPGVEVKELDELYKSFLQGDIYEEVLSKSMDTELFNLFACFESDEDIYPHICYSNDLELEFLKKFDLFKNIKEDRFVKLNDLIMKPKSYKHIFQFYAKNCEDMFMTAVSSMLDANRDGIYRSVYLADYSFNKQDDGTRFKTTANIMSILTNNHSIRTIDIYNRSKLEGINDNGRVQERENELSETENQRQEEST